MDIKKDSSIGEEENKKQVKLLRIKINGFLMDYFNYLIFSLSIIILAVGLFLLVYPKYRQISKENEEAKNNLQVEFRTKSDYLDSIRSLREIYQSINNEDKIKISSMLPATRDTSIIIAEIESIAVKNSAILNSIKIEPKQTAGERTNLNVDPEENKVSLAGIFNEPPPGVGIIKIEVKLSSVNYQILKNIIKTFENNLRLFDIAKISFDVNKNEALLNIYSYYLQQ